MGQSTSPERDRAVTHHIELCLESSTTPMMILGSAVKLCMDHGGTAHSRIARIVNDLIESLLRHLPK